VVEQRSAVLNVPNEVAIGQFADHQEITRFSSIDDRNYRPVVMRLQKLSQDISDKLTASKPETQIPLIAQTALEPIFEVPYARCSSFRGRQEVLEEMERYFNPSSPCDQLVYAITGLGTVPYSSYF
jgi:hypothetical protein